MNYQKYEASKNQRLIIKELNKEPLTFTELIARTGLSRAVVNNHIKEMESKGIIEKKYENKKILNVLVPSKIDFLEWFFAQLSALGIPEDVIEKGKKILTLEFLFKVSNCTFNDQFECMLFKCDPEHQANELERKIYADPNETLSTGSGKIKDWGISLIEEPPNARPGASKDITNWLLTKCDPYTFTIAIIYLGCAKAYDEENFNIAYKDMKKDADRVIPWWANEVMINLPGKLTFSTIGLLLFFWELNCDEAARNEMMEYYKKIYKK